MKQETKFVNAEIPIANAKEAELAAKKAEKLGYRIDDKLLNYRSNSKYLTLTDSGFFGFWPFKEEMPVIPLSEFMAADKQENPFTLVKDWREAMGLPSNNTSVNDERMDLHRSLFLEEMNELLYAIDTNDIEEVEDGVADLIFVMVGMLMELGVNPHESFYKVYESNMSKICNSEEEAQQSVDAYAKGTHPNKMGKKIECVFEKTTKDKYVVKRKSDGKVMKSINFVEPKF